MHGPVDFVHDGTPTIDGYLARPKAVGTYPAVVVIAGNKISEEYIPNTCAALALAGFVGLAPNVFHPLPVTASGDEYDKYLGKHTELDRLDDVQMGASYLRAQTFVRPGPMGVVGFCRGGREAVLFAARSREIDAVVAFHPAPLQKSDISRLTIPVQIHHGTDDHSVAVETVAACNKICALRRLRLSCFSTKALTMDSSHTPARFIGPKTQRLRGSEQRNSCSAD
jgi:carboxymethylenebutenolidase